MYKKNVWEKGSDFFLADFAHEENRFSFYILNNFSFWFFEGLVFKMYMSEQMFNFCCVCVVYFYHSCFTLNNTLPIEVLTC